MTAAKLIYTIILWNCRFQIVRMHYVAYWVLILIQSQVFFFSFNILWRQMSKIRISFLGFLMAFLLWNILNIDSLLCLKSKQQKSMDEFTKGQLVSSKTRELSLVSQGATCQTKNCTSHLSIKCASLLCVQAKRVQLSRCDAYRPTCSFFLPYNNSSTWCSWEASTKVSAASGLKEWWNLKRTTFSLLVLTEIKSKRISVFPVTSKCLTSAMSKTRRNPEGVWHRQPS